MTLKPRVKGVTLNRDSYLQTCFCNCLARILFSFYFFCSFFSIPFCEFDNQIFFQIHMISFQEKFQSVKYFKKMNISKNIWENFVQNDTKVGFWLFKLYTEMEIIFVKDAFHKHLNRFLSLLRTPWGRESSSEVFNSNSCCMYWEVDPLHGLINDSPRVSEAGVAYHHSYLKLIQSLTICFQEGPLTLYTDTQHHCLNVINDKFIVAQNVQNNKQMDSPHPPSASLPSLRFVRYNEAEVLKPMTTASPMVQAKRMVILRDNTYPFQRHWTIKNE